MREIFIVKISFKLSSISKIENKYTELLKIFLQFLEIFVRYEIIVILTYVSESFKYYFKTEDIDSNCCKLYRIGIHLLGKTFKNLFKSRMKNRREIIILESSELSKYSFTTFFNDKLNRYRFFQFVYTRFVEKTASTFFHGVQRALSSSITSPAEQNSSGKQHP